MADLAERLTNTERNQTHANRRPKDAATLLILDRTAGGPVRVLMGRRHERHVFLPGKFVFPGGRVDPGDSRVRAAGDYHEAIRDKLMHAMKGPKTETRARAFGIAAIRETFEETGVFIGTKADGPALPASDPTWIAFTERGIVPDLAPIRYIGRAITPPRRPRRFDTRFLVVFADAVADTLPGGTGPSGELEEVDWPTLAEAHDLELPTITKVIIEELEERLACDPKLAPETPVPFYYWLGSGFRRDMI
ncbi:NUDIX hydrolase [Rhodobium gokarnense]|uniref:8-oxo-dGTP pyrophosphatase MutT (NUDIX family) n=1 Tax=Rhodobium gokarnense TaxID=364296 RepID=A0ABT3HA47_9HYPH|nr:NUDIX hydrolase [Rhodobium gokarnense]MCW2307273.1 8-oxo-dGTP pyrophosphatase MutT (NUDIX family) [Rhodobium gokarnense]